MQDFIYCQRDIPKDKWRYGFRSSAATGCGWIATYNALLLMGYKNIKPESLIRFYERQLPLVHGNAGTAIYAPAVFFKRHGFDVKCTSRRQRFDDLAKESDVCILYYWWRNKLHKHGKERSSGPFSWWKMGAHFVTVEYKENEFIGYNTYRTSKGPDKYGQSLDGFLKEKKYFGAVLIGIKNKK